MYTATHGIQIQDLDLGGLGSHALNHNLCPQVGKWLMLSVQLLIAVSCIQVCYRSKLLAQNLHVTSTGPVSLLQIALANLDCVLLEARGVLEGISPHLLAEMEDVQKAQFEAASPVPEGTNLMMQRLLSCRPTAAPTHDGMVQPQGQ